MLPTKKIKFTDQWKHFKEQCPNHILLVQCGCYYNVLFEDAELCASELKWKTYYWGEALTTGIPVTTNNLTEIFSKKRIPFAIIQEVKVDGRVVGREIVECRDESGKKIPELAGNKLELSETTSTPLPPPPNTYTGEAQEIETSLSTKEPKPATDSTLDAVAAIDMLQALNGNANPLTGEVYPDNFMLNSPQVKKALGTALASLEHYKRFLKRKSKLPAKAGEGWTPEEDNKLFEAYEKGTTIKELSITHQRTQGAIKSRLMQNGKLGTTK